MNGNEGEVWVNPDGHALSFLKKDKPAREAADEGGARVAENENEMRENEPKAGNETSLVRAEVVHPIVAPAMEALGLPFHAAACSEEIAKMREVLDQAMQVFDLSKPEGILDSVFGRPDHRIRKKTERAELLGSYADAYIALLRRFRTGLEEIAKTNDVARQECISRVRAARQLAEEQIRFQRVAHDTMRKEQVEDAKARAEIAKYDGEARNATRNLELPPPPPDPLEEARRRRARNAELHIQECETAAEVEGEKVTAAKAQAIEVYRNLRITNGEKRTRIFAILDAFGADRSILPPAIQELLEEEVYD